MKKSKFTRKLPRQGEADPPPGPMEDEGGCGTGDAGMGVDIPSAEAEASYYRRLAEANVAETV